MNTGAFDSDTQRVKDASDIVDVVGEHLSLRPKGREFVALCPFHDDHNPSMAIVPHKQIFYCPVCNTGGDVLSFIQKYHRMEFRPALEYLASRAGIELTPIKSTGSATRKQDEISSEAVSQANDFAQGFFRAILSHSEHGRAARSLVNKRGISDEMVERFGIGAAPDRYDGLIRKAHQAQFDEQILAAAGLIKQRDDRRYDAMRNRLIFPIHDQMGRIIAFGGRRLNDDDEPKYLNSPETPLFQKSRALYGLYQASRSIQRTRVAVIVEGYTDVIACHQAGLTNVVATLGTALTEGHARVLRRLCDQVVLLFDGDDAGQRAADRAVEVFFTEPIDVRIATLSSVTDAKDPDELLGRQGGSTTLQQAINAGVELLEFRFRRIRTQWNGLGPMALNKALVEEVRTLARLGLNRLDPTARGLIHRRLSELTGLDGDLLAQTMRNASQTTRRTDSKPGQSATKTNRQSFTASESVVGCLLVEPKLWKAHTEELTSFLADGSFTDENCRAVANAVFGLIRSGSDPTLDAVLAIDHRPGVQSAAVALATAIEDLTDRTPTRIETMLRDCLAILATERARASAREEQDPVARLERERLARREAGNRATGNPWSRRNP